MADVLSSTKAFRRLYKGAIDPTLSWDTLDELKAYLSDPTCPKNMVVAAEGQAYIICENELGELRLVQLGTLESTDLGNRISALENTKYDNVLIKNQEAKDGSITPYLEFYANEVLVKTIEIGGNGLTTAQLENLAKIPEIEADASEAYNTAITVEADLEALALSTEESLRLKAETTYVDSIKDSCESRITTNEEDIASIKTILDELTYKYITTTSFSLSNYSAEMGSTLGSLKVSWEYNKTPTSQTLNGEALDTGVRSKVFTYLTKDTTFKLSATDGKTTVNKSANLTFVNGRYFGSSNATEYDSKFILSMSKVLSGSRVGSFTTTCGVGQHVFFAIPTRYGTPTFTVNGFTGGFAKVSTLDFTNASGYTESYDVYKSDNSNLGNITVVVG